MKIHRSLEWSQPEQGSALLPVVAAMLILVLCGVALSEVFGAQRMQSVMNIEAARASWIAEAGLWHAAHEETAITSVIPFGGGSYTVSKLGATYTATGVMAQATIQTTRQMLPLDGPLDVAASASTILKVSNKKFSLDLVSIWPDDVEIESFEFSDDSGSYAARKFKLDGANIWDVKSGVDMPLSLTALNKGSSAQRTVAAGASPSLEYESKADPSGTITYSLILHFTDQTQSTLGFSVTW